MRAKFAVALTIFAVAISLAGCVAPPPRRASARRPAPPAPCSTPVAPIRNTHVLVVINYNYTYTPKGPTEVRSGLRDLALERLNQLGRPDGNSFSETNGQQMNFTVNYTLNNDGQDHYTGSAELRGWGQGYLTTQTLNQYSYASVIQLNSDLTDKVYNFIRGGWHDARPNCPQY
jgi:hypothetical protein